MKFHIISLRHFQRSYFPHCGNTCRASECRLRRLFTWVCVLQVSQSKCHLSSQCVHSEPVAQMNVLASRARNLRQTLSPTLARRSVNPTRIFISAPSFTDIFASFLAGRWADKFSRVSYLLLSLTLTEVFASALYLVARDE